MWTAEMSRSTWGADLCCGLGGRQSSLEVTDCKNGTGLVRFQRQHGDQEWAGYKVNYVSFIQCGSHRASQKRRRTCITSKYGKVL